jgi:hypothetical protein
MEKQRRIDGERIGIDNKEPVIIPDKASPHRSDCSRYCPAIVSVPMPASLTST